MQRGGDFMRRYPDTALQARLDGYIARIRAAADVDADGYLNTFVQLGGQQRLSNGYNHELYNAGNMADGAVEYYRATGSTTLRYAACRFANYLTATMGPGVANYVPEHEGPEERYVKLYQLFKSEPAPKAGLRRRVPRSRLDCGGLGVAPGVGAIGEEDVHPVIVPATGVHQGRGFVIRAPSSKIEATGRHANHAPTARFGCDAARRARAQAPGCLF